MLLNKNTVTPTGFGRNGNTPKSTAQNKRPKRESLITSCTSCSPNEGSNLRKNVRYNCLPRQLFENITATESQSSTRHLENRNCSSSWLIPKSKSPKKCLENFVSPTEGPEVDSPFKKRLLEKGVEKIGKIQLLGRGAFGRVILALHKGTKVALKVTKCQFFEPKEGNAQNLVHPNIARVLGIYHSEFNCLVVMEYAGSRNLQTVLFDPQLSIPLSFQNSCCIQISSAIAYCHKHGVIHMDLKPANVIVSTSGICKLSDFGCSILIELYENRSSMSRIPRNYLPGTVPYLAPEILRGQTPSTQADIYALGICIWQIFSRRLPFRVENPHVLIYQVVTKGLRPETSGQDRIAKPILELVEKCWTDSPILRPEAKEIVEQLFNNK